jgi:hypothetical protein
MEGDTGRFPNFPLKRNSLPWVFDSWWVHLKLSGALIKIPWFFIASRPITIGSRGGVSTAPILCPFINVLLTIPESLTLSVQLKGFSPI